MVFSSSRDGVRNLYWQAADGRGSVERLTTSSNIQSPWSWSPDGSTLVFQQQKPPPAQDWDIFSLSMRERQAAPLIHTDATELDAQVSPNGKWLAFSSSNEIWVRPFPNVDGGRWRVSTSGGRQPKWAADGRTLFFRGGKPPSMYRVDVVEQPGFAAGTPNQLFDAASYTYVAGARDFDIGKDGRFLFRKAVGAQDRTTSPAALVVIVDWAAGLKRLVQPTR